MKLPVSSKSLKKMYAGPSFSVRKAAASSDTVLGVVLKSTNERPDAEPGGVLGELETAISHWSKGDSML